MSLYAPNIDRHGEPDRSNPSPQHIAHEAAATVTQPYAIRTVPGRNLVHIAIAGFWTRDVVARFGPALHAAVATLKCGQTGHIICCDVSKSAIQPQDVIFALQKLIAQGPTRARKLALFTTNLRARMQARRIVLVRDNIAFFETEAAAIAWLVAEDEAV